jgi:hypothetical protein
MHRAFRTIPEQRASYKDQEKPAQTTIVITRTAISIMSNGTPIQWMAPVSGNISNANLLVTSNDKVKTILSIHHGESTTTIPVELVAGNNPLPNQIVAAGDRFGLDFPTGASEIWFSGIFTEGNTNA